MGVKVPHSLLEKHNKPGPRYTSYPTVPAWTTSFGEEDYRTALEELAGQRENELSVYLHLPFCAKHCHYCGCNSVISGEKDAVNRYLDRVERELEMITAIIGTNRRVVQLHWGGGTPNFLKNAQINRAFTLLKQAFTIDANGEISIEVDPRIGTPEQASFLRGLGFNRISLGVQDFAAEVQTAIGRIQPRERTLNLYNACRAAGFEGVNLDLVYGLPAQTRDSFTDTLQSVLDLAPDRVACFSYAHVPWVRPVQNQVDTTKLPTPFEKFDLFQLAIDMFDQKGYDWIGIDHFARREDELAVAQRDRRLHRNFMGYTTRPAPHMLAVGMSGIGEVAGCFAQNDAQLESYLSAVDKGQLPIVRGHRLTADDLLRRKAIIHLMCNLELPFALTREEYGAGVDTLLADELKRLRAYEAEGFLIFGAEGLQVTDLGRFFVRNLCMELDAYLDHQSDRPLFSKTI